MTTLETLHPLKRHWIARSSNIPLRYITWSFESIAKDMGSIPDDLTEWMGELLNGEIILNPGEISKTGVGLLFDGEPGRGKTTHAVSVLTEFIRNLPDNDAEAQSLMHVSPSSYGHKFRPVYYLTYPEFLSRKKAVFDADYDDKRRLQDEMDGFHGRSRHDNLNVRLLVLDDVGKDYKTDFNDTSFYEILRTRYDKGLPTVVTTNIEREKWDQVYGTSMGSFAHEAFRRVKLDGKDLRRD
jgi:DNA replication protein DnaC